MDYQVLFNIVVGAFGVLGGFVLNAVWQGLKDLRESDDRLAEKIGKFEVLVAGEYIKRDELNARLDTSFVEMFKRLDRIESKLDKKVDRDDCRACWNEK